MKNKRKNFQVMYKTIVVFVSVAMIIAIVIFLRLLNSTEPENGIARTALDYWHISLVITITLSIITVAGTAGIAFRNHQIKEVDATNKRFNEAVSAMAHGDKYVRIQGIYALERLAKNTPNEDERQNVVDLLCTYLRDKRNVDNIDKLKETEEQKTESERKDILTLDEDFKAIIMVIKRLRDKFPEICIDLNKANLYWANLERANLEHANLERANLNHAKLVVANLNGTNLKMAILRSANLTSANLTSANLTSADLTWANLEGADLDNAHLEGAVLKNAHLEGADLKYVIIDNKTNFQLAFIDEKTIISEKILEVWKMNREYNIKFRKIRKKDRKNWILERKQS